MFGFLMFILLLVVLPYQFIANGLSFKKRIKHYSEVTDADKFIFKINPNSNNPWAKRILDSPLYGTVPGDINKLMKRISADPDEKVIGTVWASQNAFMMGYLIATTSYLRWIQVFPFRNDNTFWQYNTRVTTAPIGRNFSPIFIGGREFNLKGFRNFGVRQKFKNLCELIQQALLHTDALEPEVNVHTEQQPKHKIETHNSSIAEEIQKLASLKEQNIITEEEFKAGKQRLLDKN